MDEFEFIFENDTLIRNEISKTEQPNVFHIKKIPVINKEAFLLCYKQWVKAGEENDE